MKRTILLLTPLLFSAGCSVTSPSDPKEGVGPVIARYTLTAEDGNAPPCCAIDSAGVHITVVGGALTFHGPAGYLVSHEPNDAFILVNRLLKNGDQVYWLTHPATALELEAWETTGPAATPTPICMSPRPAAFPATTVPQARTWGATSPADPVG